VVLVILHYFLALDPLKSPYWTPGDAEDDAQATPDDGFRPNSIDVFVIDGIRWVGEFIGSRLREGRASRSVYSWLGRRFSQRSRWEHAFRTVSHFPNGHGC
jgi:hypothetical protein